MKKVMRGFIVLTALSFSFFAVARLSSQEGYIMAGAGFTLAQYQEATSEMTDCATLQYYLQNQMGVTEAISRAITRGYLMYRDHDGSGGDFTSCDLGFIPGSTNTVLSASADLTDANFSSATMDGANFSSAMLNRVNMEGASLQSAIFDFANAAYQTIILTSADLTGANFDTTWFVQPYFNSADLTDALFSNAKMRNANFQNANLTNAEFFLCDLHGADFTGATCNGTKFYDIRGTITFFGTDLTDADFEKTTMLYFYYDESNLPVFSNTTMPDGTKCTGDECIKHFYDYCLTT